MDHSDMVERFLHAYFGGEADAAMACVGDDFEWVNMALPKATIRGRAALATKLAVPNLGLPLPLEQADHETTLAIVRGEYLMHERVDRLRFAGEELEIPCAAAWRFAEGRIAAWRDYFDMGLVLHFFSRLGHPLDTSKWW